MARFQFHRKSRSVPANPVALFETLKRADDIKNPWWHQKDVMDAYLGLPDQSDVAIELPTGAGKTLVGMLLGEFIRRRDESRVLYLCPTRQLCAQVVKQASAYGITAVNLSGPKKLFNQDSLTSYLRNECIAVSTYSGLFNVKPGVEDPNLVICDDAHAAEHYVLALWKLRIERFNEKHSSLFDKLHASLAPYLPRKIKVVLAAQGDKVDRTFVELLSPMMVHPALNDIEAILNAAELPDDLKYSWHALKTSLTGLLLTADFSAFEFRPYIAPTHTHQHFAGATRRLYLTATLGKNGDLERYFGRRSIAKVPIPSGWEKKGTGRRLVLFPAYSQPAPVAQAQLLQIIGERVRALILANSTSRADKWAEALDANGVKVLGGAETESDLEVFTASQQPTALVIANRYDGLDFKGDTCRLLVLVGLPTGAGQLERFLNTRLAAVAVLRDRIVTRITQAVGRCTRDERDYALVLMWGDDLLAWCSKSENRKALLPELQAEIQLGLDSSRECEEGGLLELAKHFFAQDEVWEEANEEIIAGREELSKSEDASAVRLGELVSKEVLYCQLILSGQFGKAYETASELADQLGSEVFKPYRGFWYHEAATAAFWAWQESNDATFKDACLHKLEKAASAALGLSWVPQAKARIEGTREAPPTDGAFPELQWFLNIEELLGQWKYDGARFAAEIGAARKLIKSTDWKDFEQGIEILGRMLGARSYRWVNVQGAPDGLWMFDDWLNVLFEAKTQQGHDGPISKLSVQQAAGHEGRAIADSLISTSARNRTVVVSDRAVVASIALPYIGELFVVKHSFLLDTFELAADALASVRARTGALQSGEGLEIAKKDFKEKGVYPVDLVKRLLGTSLSEYEVQ